MNVRFIPVWHVIMFLMIICLHPSVAKCAIVQTNIAKDKEGYRASA